MQPPPPVRLNFEISLVLLLACGACLNPGPEVHKLHLAPFNACSMERQSPFMTCNNIDILSNTDTWLTAKETSADLTELTAQGFSFFQKPRAQRREGEVGLFVSSAHRFTSVSPPTQTSCESIFGKLESGQSFLNILNICCPPGPTTALFSEFQDTLSYMASLPQDLALLGDLNVRINSAPFSY